MKLKELFAAVPIHSRLVLNVRDTDGKYIDTVRPALWCDDSMPNEFGEYKNAEITDIVPDGCNNGITICVTSADRLVKSNRGWSYFDEDGEEYEIAELYTPNATATYDIGVLIHHYDGDDACGYDFINYVCGVTDMTDRELLCFCRGEVDAYKNGWRNGWKNS